MLNTCFPSEGLKFWCTWSRRCPCYQPPENPWLRSLWWACLDRNIARMLVHFCCWRRRRLCLTSHWKERASGSCRWIPPDSTCGPFFYDLLNSLPLALSTMICQVLWDPWHILRLKRLCPVEAEDLCFNLCGRTLFFFAWWFESHVQCRRWYFVLQILISMHLFIHPSITCSTGP